MSKGSISKKEIPTPEKGIRKKRKKKKKKKKKFILEPEKQDTCRVVPPTKRDPQPQYTSFTLSMEVDINVDKVSGATSSKPTSY
jgi:hypothetical protein